MNFLDRSETVKLGIKKVYLKERVKQDGVCFIQETTTYYFMGLPVHSKTQLRIPSLRDAIDIHKDIDMDSNCIIDIII